MIKRNKFLVKTLSFMIFMMVAGFPQSRIENFNFFSAERIESMDWIFYFSNAYHKTWKAFNPYASAHRLELRHESGKDTLLDGKYYWTNLNAPLNSKIIYGPSVWQSSPYREERGYRQVTRYRVPANEWCLDTIRYRVDFHLRRLSNGDGIRRPYDTLCLAKVIIHYEDGGLVKDSVITHAVRSGELVNTNLCYISYKLGFLEDNTSPFEFAGNHTSGKKLLGIEFELENKTTREFYAVESIEVSDSFIWENYFSPIRSSERMSRLFYYLKSLQTDDNINASMTSRVEDYEIEIPAPNSVDNYDAIQILGESIAYLYKEGLVLPVKKPHSPLRTSSNNIILQQER